MKYVILAAGKGSRLHPITHHIPKPLVSLITGKSILEYEICNVAKTGLFDEVLIITGYMDAMIKHVVSKLHCPIPISCISNSNWQNPSPLFSLHAISRTIKLHDVVISNGDTVHSLPFFNIFKIKHPVEDIRLFISSAVTIQKDDMRVMISAQADRLIHISKDISYDETNAISSGALLLKGDAKRALFLNELSLSLSRTPVPLTWHALLNTMANKGMRINYSFTPYNSWFEVDSIEDLIQANKYI